MAKPTIFFSHSSKDLAALSALKASYVSRTSGSIDVFLSSDGQSIPLGKNWVHAVEEALGLAELMIVFVTPSSLRSSWLYFESGYAYCKKLRVIPVGFLGADLSAMPAPLSLLQGFNITSEGGLNNLIAISNDVFGHRHKESFTLADYQSICGSSTAALVQSFGEHSALVDQVRFFLQSNRDFSGSSESLLDAAHSIFNKEGVNCQREENRLDVQGLSFVSQSGNGPDEVTVNVEGVAVDHSLPLAARALRETCIGGLAGRTIVLDFISGIRFVSAYHKRSGRLLGTGVTLAPGEHLQYGDLTFTVGRRKSRGAFLEGVAYLGAKLNKDELPVEQLRQLLTLLMDRSVIFVGSIADGA